MPSCVKRCGKRTYCSSGWAHGLAFASMRVLSRVSPWSQASARCLLALQFSFSQGGRSTGNGSLRSTAFARLFDDWGTQPRQAREQYVALAMNVKSFLQGPVWAEVPQKPGAAVPARREVILRNWRTSSYPVGPQERRRVKALRGGVWPPGNLCTPSSPDVKHWNLP